MDSRSDAYGLPLNLDCWLILMNLPRRMSDEELWLQLNINDDTDIICKKTVSHSDEKRKKNAVLMYTTQEAASSALAHFSLQFQNTPFCVVRVSDVVYYMDNTEELFEGDLGTVAKLVVHKQQNLREMCRHLFSACGEYQVVRINEDEYYAYPNASTALVTVWALDNYRFQDFALRVERLFNFDPYIPFKKVPLILKMSSINLLPNEEAYGALDDWMAGNLKANLDEMVEQQSVLEQPSCSTKESLRVKREVSRDKALRERLLEEVSRERTEQPSGPSTPPHRGPHTPPGPSTPPPRGPHTPPGPSTPPHRGPHTPPGPDASQVEVAEATWAEPIEPGTVEFLSSTQPEGSEDTIDTEGNEDTMPYVEIDAENVRIREEYNYATFEGSLARQQAAAHGHPPEAASFEELDFIESSIEIQRIIEESIRAERAVELERAVEHAERSVEERAVEHAERSVEERAVEHAERSVEEEWRAVEQAVERVVEGGTAEGGAERAAKRDPTAVQGAKESKETEEASGEPPAKIARKD